MISSHWYSHVIKKVHITFPLATLPLLRLWLASFVLPSTFWFNCWVAVFPKPVSFSVGLSLLLLISLSEVLVIFHCYPSLWGINHLSLDLWTVFLAGPSASRQTVFVPCKFYSMPRGVIRNWMCSHVPPKAFQYFFTDCKMKSKPLYLCSSIYSQLGIFNML